MGTQSLPMGSLFQCFTTLLMKKLFLLSNLNFPWGSLRLCPLALSLVSREKRPTPTWLNLLLGSCRSDKITPGPPFLQTEQPQLPQPVLIGLVLQTLPQPRCPCLDMLQHPRVLLIVRGPELNTGFKVCPHQCQEQGNNQCPGPAGHTIADTGQDAIGLAHT